ncbi:CRISPR-associated protein Cas4 [Ruminococcus gauvreauii]|uniref:CRISPR-associated protein Cas4 n=1 Tax=Ruminococcus gauvreauii TaxID=438033 RepID=UPI0039841D38
MKVNGTLINYYFHCKRQCYLHGNRLNLEDNSEQVKIGKAIHEEKAEEKKDTEITVDNIRLDRLTKEYLTEIKKSDADVEASKWQLLYYLSVLKEKGVIRKGRLEFVEKNKKENKVLYLELTEELEEQLRKYVREIEELLQSEKIPECVYAPKCKKCAYYEYCYI